jgi:hypothetical protein
VSLTVTITTTAYAACGNHSGAGATAVPNLMALANLPSAPSNGGAASIVGLWHVFYYSEGQLFYDALDTWHGDGTEIESANFPPIEGNLCMGVWKLVGSEIHLTHVGWVFDNLGNPAGMFTLTERNIIAGDGNSYRGSYDYKQYDTQGNLTLEVKGTLTATRIGVS